MTSQILEQHQQGATKRPSDCEAENDNKSGKKRKVVSDKIVDSSTDSNSTDSSGDEIEATQQQVPLGAEIDGRSRNEDTTDGPRREADYSESCEIQAVLRRGENTGSLMRARLDGNKTKATLDFMGTDPDDSLTVFHLEKNDDKQGVNVLRFTDKSKRDNYYLRVYRGGRVRLRKLVNYPTNNKYLFHIKCIGNMIQCPRTFKSVQTGEYLSCDEKGEARMLEITTTDGKGETKDRRTWFCIHFCCQSDGNLVES